ncbi:MAG: VWA domain-containing protein [bacterium]|nr:VWA domain-containing protein [bacterium]
MIGKRVFILLFILLLATGVSFGKKYTVNSSGTVKTDTGKIITSPANTINQNPYSNYQTNTYVNTNQVNATQVGIIEFVMDYSGSMSNWIEVAKRSMYYIAQQIPTNILVGFRVFGHDNNGSNPAETGSTLQEVKKIVKTGNKFKVVTTIGCVGKTYGACSSTKQVSPITQLNINALLSGMNSVKLGGSTPLVYALDRTVNQDFVSLDKITPKKIVLITDGGENCGGDPCAFAKKLMNSRNDVHIDVVLVSSNSKALACLAGATGGHFYTVNDLSDFSTVITTSINTAPVEPVKNQSYEFIGE